MKQEEVNLKSYPLNIVNFTQLQHIEYEKHNLFGCEYYCILMYFKIDDVSHWLVSLVDYFYIVDGWVYYDTHIFTFFFFPTSSFLVAQVAALFTILFYKCIVRAVVERGTRPVATVLMFIHAV